MQKNEISDIHAYIFKRVSLTENVIDAFGWRLASNFSCGELKVNEPSSLFELISLRFGT